MGIYYDNYICIENLDYGSVKFETGIMYQFQFHSYDYANYSQGICVYNDDFDRCFCTEEEYKIIKRKEKIKGILKD